MDERVIQFRVGVVVVAAGIITSILVVVFGEIPRIVSRQQTVYVRFVTAPGVTIDTPVRKSGILIGRVSRIDLLDDGGVLVTASVDAGRVLRRNEVCRIRTGTFLGDALLEFVPSSDPAASAEPIQDGEYLDGVVTSDPLDAMRVLVNLEGDMVRALGSIQDAGNEVGQVARNMNVLVENNQDQFNRIMAKSEQALDRFDSAMATVNELVGDEELRDKLRQALEDVPQVLTDARQLMASLDSLAQRADKNMQNLEGITGPLGERGEAIVNRVDQSVTRLDELMEQLVQFSQSLNSSEGTVGQLIHNPDLYQKLNRAAENIEEISFRLRPIVDDARVFADKIARDPGRLGVKGALDRRQSGIK